MTHPDDWKKWTRTATRLASRFQVAVDANQRDDEFATAWDMMEFLQETVAALKSTNVGDDINRVALFNADGTARTLDEVRMEAMRKSVALKSNDTLDSYPTFQRSEPYGPALDLE